MHKMILKIKDLWKNKASLFIYLLPYWNLLQKNLVISKTFFFCSLATRKLEKQFFWPPIFKKKKNCLEETLSFDYYHRTLASLTLIYSFQKCRKFQIYIQFSKNPIFVKGIREYFRIFFKILLFLTLNFQNKLIFRHWNHTCRGTMIS